MILIENQKEQEILKELESFTGTRQYFVHSLTGVRYTDGIKYLAESCKAYWLIDYIAFKQVNNWSIKNDHDLKEFQLWKVKKDKDSVDLSFFRDTGDLVSSEKIPFTDFPLNEVKLYCIRGVLLLPSEY